MEKRTVSCLARIVDTKEYLDMVCTLLEQGQGIVSVPIKGVSMRPFLRDQDLAFLQKPERPAKPGDILLFQRKTGQYILHRVMKLLPEGRLVMLGDSQFTSEEIGSDQVRAIMTRARIGGKDFGPGSFKWWFFEKPWRWLAPVRKYIYKIYGWAKGIYTKPGR